MLVSHGIIYFYFLQVVGVTSSPQASGDGLYFCDGRRKVDYVLVYHYKRHTSLRAPAGVAVPQDELSIVSNGNFPPTTGSNVVQGRGVGPRGEEAASVGEVFMELGNARGNEPMEAAAQEMQLIRQEFEANLLDAGLEIERDREVSVCKAILMFIFSFE